MPHGDELIRSEYAALADVTHELCGWFGYDPGPARLDAVKQGLVACEAIDRFLDDGGCRDARFSTLASAVHGVRTGTWIDGPAGQLQMALGTALTNEEIVESLWAIERATRGQFTTDRSRFIEAVQQEGRAFARLFLPVFDDAPEAFVRFFESLGAPGNLIDKFLDARMDHADGALWLKPGVRHHTRLALAFLAHAPQVLWRARRRRRFLRWTWRLFRQQAAGAARPSPPPETDRALSHQSPHRGNEED